MSEYSKRETKDYNLFRSIFQWITCQIFVGAFVKLMYKYKIEGKENIPQNERFIVTANHLANIDPFLVRFALNKHIAFMAKEQLFEKFFSKKLMDFCGAFAVNREKVEVSTIKTALNIKNTNWMLGIFPQGTRDTSDATKKITKGFASFAKATKTGILPVAIIGSNTKPKLFSKNDLIVKVGKMIPYSNNLDQMMEQWCETLTELTGKQFVLE